MKRSFLPFFLLSLALGVALALGCSSSSDGASPGGGSDLDAAGDASDAVTVLPDGATVTDTEKDSDAVDPSLGWECEEDVDCAGALICDCKHKCREPGWLFCAGTLCRDEASCDKWDKCVRCESDMNCGHGMFCDPCSHMCHEQRGLCDPCTPTVCDPVSGVCEESGSQCIDYGVCIEYVDGNSYCGVACLSDYGCPPQYKCREIPGIADMQCIPETGTCENLVECESDTDCVYGEICNESLGVCAMGCLDDEACSGDLICSGFHCTTPCDDVNNPCAADYECADDGRCKKPGSCIDWRDCEEPETYCDLESHMCKPGCMQDVDCKTAAKVCENMSCVTRACKAAWSCAFGQMCRLDEVAEDFGDCYEPEGPYCDACNGDDPDSCGEENLCVNFQDEDGNDKGAYCLVACNLADPDNLCPQGWECAEIEDQDGNVDHQCARTCYQPPVTDY